MLGAYFQMAKCQPILTSRLKKRVKRPRRRTTHIMKVLKGTNKLPRTMYVARSLHFVMSPSPIAHVLSPTVKFNLKQNGDYNASNVTLRRHRAVEHITSNDYIGREQTPRQQPR